MFASAGLKIERWDPMGITSMPSHPPAAGHSRATPRIAALVALATAVSTAIAGLMSPGGIDTAAAVIAASLTAGAGAAFARRSAAQRTSTDPSAAHQPTPPDHNVRLDQLTALPDRASTQHELLTIIDAQTPFTIAVADIDDFGQINDTAGREAGDQALRILADTTRRAVRPVDTVGRIGGDELLVIFPDTTTDDAVKALERLRENLFIAQTTGEVVAFTVSIGVTSSAYGGPIDKILVNAADALQLAKTQGGNRVAVTPGAQIGQTER